MSNWRRKSLFKKLHCAWTPPIKSIREIMRILSFIYRPLLSLRYSAGGLILEKIEYLSQKLSKMHSRVHVPYTFWEISAWKPIFNTSFVLIASGDPGLGCFETQKLRLVLYYRHLKGVLVSGVVVNINYEIKYLFLMIDNSPRWRWFYRVCGFSASKMGLKHQNTVRMTS